jgi:hypothetical protein
MKLEQCGPTNADYALVDIDMFMEISDKYGPFHYIPIRDRSHCQKCKGVVVYETDDYGLCDECAKRLIQVIEKV